MHTAQDIEIPEVLGIIQSKDWKFGVIHIKTPKVQMTKTPLAIYMNIDRSGSMDDMCSDGRTKMTHLKHTIKNMIRLFSTYTFISVCIVAFDSVVEELTDGFELITTENVEYFYKIINKINPMGTTNIELSLKNAMKRISESSVVCPIHIQFTDGEASSGKTEIHELLKNINSSYKNIFIGFGETHDSYLLSRFAEHEGIGKNEYRFIDQIENAGMVCGEIIYNILYPYTTECLSINMTGKNMKIYNWMTNEWVSSIIIPPLSGDCEKMYHIQEERFSSDDCSDDSRSSTVEDGFDEGVIRADLVCCMDGKEICIEHIECIPNLIDNDSLEICPVDLTKYMFRQKTLELLYESRQLETHQYELKENEKENENTWMNKKYTSGVNKDIIDIHSRMLKLFKRLQEYWNTLVDEEEKVFIKILMDDIHIAKKTLGTDRGHMYSCSRQISQGSQFIYKVGGTNDTELTEQYDDIGRWKNEYITSPSTKTPYENVMILDMMSKVCEDEENIEVEDEEDIEVEDCEI